MNENSSRFKIPAALRSAIGTLLDQQFWLLGCDVRYHGGNLLLELGFERVRPPSEWKAATQYSLHIPPEGSLRLWGFGFWYKLDLELGVFVRRSEFAPRLCQIAQPLWKIEDLPPLRMPGTVEEVNQVWRALVFVWDWFANYEEWIVQRCGVNYRRQVWLQWNKKRVGEPERLACCWRQAAKDTQLLLKRLPSLVG